MNLTLYFILALIAYCGFTFYAAFTGGIRKATVDPDAVFPWFMLWVALGLAWPISVPATISIKMALEIRGQKKKSHE